MRPRRKIDEEQFVVLSSRSLMKRSIASRAYAILSDDAMLPLESSRMPRLTGTRSLLNLRDLLLFTVVKDREVVLAQAAHETAVAIGD
jgi:hypothetical protein